MYITTHIYSFTATLTNKNFVIFITHFDYILLYYILIIQLISYYVRNKTKLIYVMYIHGGRHFYATLMPEKNI